LNLEEKHEVILPLHHPKLKTYIRSKDEDHGYVELKTITGLALAYQDNSLTI
jgi:hypothetical protein